MDFEVGVHYGHEGQGYYERNWQPAIAQNQGAQNQHQGGDAAMPDSSDSQAHSDLSLERATDSDSDDSESGHPVQSGGQNEACDSVM